MTPLSQGLYVSVVGIVIIFIIMAIFWAIMVLLQRLFPVIRENGAEEQPVAVKQSAAVDEQAIVAAIAVALCSSKGSPDLGKALESGRSLWWQAGIAAAGQGKK